MDASYKKEILSSLELPKHKWLQLHLEQLINEGHYKPGDRLPNGKDLMKMYNCSHTTVSRAMRAMVDSKVIVRIRKQGTFVSEKLNSSALTINKLDNKNASIAFIHRRMPDSFHPYYTGLLNGLLEGASENNMSVKFIATDDGNIGLDSKFLYQHNCIGVIESVTRREELEAAILLNIPIVSLTSLWAEIPVDRVYSDTRYQMVLALEHVKKLGHKNIAIAHRFFRDAWREAASEVFNCGVDEIPLEMLQVMDFSIDASRNAVERLKSMNPRPTALIITDDFLIKYFLQALAESRIRVPEEISFVGFGTPFTERLLGISCTLVEVDPVKIGQTVVCKLMEKISGKPPEGSVTKIKPELVIRNSCGMTKKSNIFPFSIL